MHWLESSVYFSAAPLISFFAPLWVFRFLAKSLILFPLEGHAGFGSWSVESSFNHYIHHSKFYWNFGSSPMWDHIMGTNYRMDKKRDGGEDDREKEALDQAKLVGAAMGDGGKDGTSNLKEAKIKTG